MTRSVAGLCLLLAACAVGPDYVRPTFDLPSAWRVSEPAATAPARESEWWRQFGDPVLDRLVAAGLALNHDLLTAAARVDEARAALAAARANQALRVDAGASYGKGRSSAYAVTPGTPLVAQRDAAGVTLSWEIDLWGRLRRSREAAQAGFAASRHAYAGARLSLAAQIAQTYFQLLALDAQSAVAEATLESRLQSLALREARFRGGLTSALDWRQAQAQADAARVAIPGLRQSLELTEHALALLIGMSAREMMAPPGRGNALFEQALPLVLPPGLPSELLDRRPDLAQSEQELIAANAQIGVARASYFPSISLTGALGSQSPALVSLFTGPAQTWNFAAAVAAPVLDFGLTAAGVDAATARREQALAQYRRAVQNAFRETLDALSEQRMTGVRELAQREKRAALHEVLRLARLRYDNGYASYLDVLDAERDDFQAELDQVQARLDRLDAAVDLFKALGGGWTATD